MKEPSSAFLTELAHALKQAKHKNVAQHLAAGLLWAIYPEWFETFSGPRNDKVCNCGQQHDAIEWERGYYFPCFPAIRFITKD